MTDIIKQSDHGEFSLAGLARNESVWLRVENFDLSIKRTDEGIVVNVHTFTEDKDYGDETFLAGCWAMDP